jgi:hypothetical protein
MDPSDGSAFHDLFYFLVVLSVAVLVRHNSLYSRSSYNLANLDRLIHGECKWLFVGDQPCVRFDSNLDKIQADRGGRAKTEDVRPDFSCQGQRVRRSSGNSQFCGYLRQPPGITTRDASEFETRVIPKSRGMVLSALSNTYDEYFVDLF